MRRIIYLSVIFSIVFLSCEKEKIETDPKKAILGKWEIIEIGNWPNMESTLATGYTEFTPDSIVRFYDYKLKQFTSQGKYWISDTILFESQIREDGFELVLSRKFELLNNNQKLRLDYIDILAIFNTSIYKRLK
jgi:hypothetical protein